MRQRQRERKREGRNEIEEKGGERIEIVTNRGFSSFCDFQPFLCGSERRDVGYLTADLRHWASLILNPRERGRGCNSILFHLFFLSPSLFLSPGYFFLSFEGETNRINPRPQTFLVDFDDKSFRAFRIVRDILSPISCFLFRCNIPLPFPPRLFFLFSLSRHKERDRGLRGYGTRIQRFSRPTIDQGSRRG